MPPDRVSWSLRIFAINIDTPPQLLFWLIPSLFPVRLFGFSFTLVLHFLLTKQQSHCCLQHNVKALLSSLWRESAVWQITFYLSCLLRKPSAWETGLVFMQHLHQVPAGSSPHPNVGPGWHQLGWKCHLPTASPDWNRRMGRIPHVTVCLFISILNKLCSQKVCSKKAKSKAQRSHKGFPTSLGSG